MNSAGLGTRAVFKQFVIQCPDSINGALGIYEDSREKVSNRRKNLWNYLAAMELLCPTALERQEINWN